MATLDTLQTAITELMNSTAALISAVTTSKAYLDTKVSAAAAQATLAASNAAAQITLATAQAALAASNKDTQVALAAAQAALATTNGAAQVALATTQAGLATTNGAVQVALATTQANLAASNAAAQIALATTQANNAAANKNTQVALAAAQAGLATTNGATQVGLATTQANLATSNGAAQVTLATAQVTLATSNQAAQTTLATTQATNTAANEVYQTSLAATQAGLATTNGAAQVTLATTQANLAISNGATQTTLSTAQAALAITNGAAQVTLATTQANNAISNKNAQVALATTQAGLATSNGAAQVTLATTQAGIAASNLTAATTQANTAAGNLTSATNQVTLTTAQAVLAAGSATTASNNLTSTTTQATNASGSATTSSNSAATSTTQAGIATTQATNAGTSLTNTNTQSTNAATSLTNTLAQAALATTQVSAASLSYASAASQYTVASNAANSALSVLQQDLSAVSNFPLHRSPNAIVDMFIYNTANDSDGGEWIEKQQDKSWFNEPTMGTWLVPTAFDGFQSELEARGLGATTSTEQNVDPNFSSSTGWTILNGGGQTTTISGGKINFTNIGSGNGFAIRTDMVSGIPAIGQVFLCTVVIDSLAVSGSIRVVIGGSILRVLPTAGTYTFPVVNLAATNNIELRSLGLNTGVISRFSVKTLTAFTTTSGSYYQLNTDGKFYRLYRNLLKNSILSGTVGGPGTYPTGWSVLGGQTANVALASESVNGVVTGVVKIRRIASTGFEGMIQVLGTPLWLGAFGVSVLVRVPTGVTAGDFASYDVGGGSFTIASAATLNAQAKDVWVSYTVTHTTTASRASFGFTQTTGAIGAGFDFAMPSVEIGAVTTYDATPVSFEVYRGNSAKFPRLAGIVAEAASVTIYDLTQPGRPMWMRFRAQLTTYFLFNTAGSVAMLNGLLVVGSNAANGDCYFANFPKDTAYRIQGGGNSGFWTAGITGRNTVYNGGTVTFDSNLGITLILPNRVVNAVAMTVLPDAPVDPYTGLRIPTIAVGTGSGVSIIQNNGVIRNSAVTSSIARVKFSPGGVFYQVIGRYTYFAINVSTLAASFVQTAGYDYANLTTVPSMLGEADQLVVAKRSMFLRGSSGGSSSPSGINLVMQNEADPTKGIVARITGTYNTGWLSGDNKRCYLSDTVVETIGPSTELVTNGTFTTDTAGWTVFGTNTIASVSGRLQITYIDNANGAYSPVIPLVIGKAYTLLWNAATGSSTPRVTAWSSPSAGILIMQADGNQGDRTFTFVATTTTMYITCFPASPTVGQTATFDNISVKTSVADRSPKSQSANIYGTLTKALTHVANQQVAYTGWSAANFLQESYSLDLDYGIADFNLSGKFNTLYGNVNANLLTFPEQFDNAVWQKSVGTVTANTTTAPDGTTTADTLIEDTTTGSHQIAVSAYVTIALGIAYTCSVYIKPNGRTRIRLAFDAFAFTTAPVAYFDFTAGGSVDNVTGGATASITAAANGFFRCVMTVTSTVAAANRPILYIASVSTGTIISYTGDGVSGYYLWGAKANQGTSAGTYTPGQTAVYNPLAIIAERRGSVGAYFNLGIDGTGKIAGNVFDGITLRTVSTINAYNLGVLYDAEMYYTAGILGIRINGVLENSVVGTPLNSVSAQYNLVTFSEQLDNAAWIKFSGSVTANTTLAFDGTTSADTYTEDTSANIHWFRQQFTTIASAASVTGSIYLHAGTRRYVTISLSNGSNGCYAVVDTVGWTITQAAAVGTGTYTSSSITLASTGIYRVTLTGTVPSTVVNFQIEGTTGATPGNYNISYTGTSSTIIAWGAQFELGTVKAYQRVSTVPETNLPVLTIGNSFAIDSAFSGSICFVKSSATIMGIEAAAWAYSSEAAMFADGVQCLLPASTGVIDADYDALEDRFKIAQSGFDFNFNGLVRTSSTALIAGSISKLRGSDGIKLLARITINPGVDFFIPAYGIREELIRKAEAAARLVKVASLLDTDTISFTATTTNQSNQLTAVASVVGTPYLGMGVTATNLPTNTVIKAINGAVYTVSNNATATGTTQAIAQCDFAIPVGFTATEVISAGNTVREGSTKTYTRLFDGFKETIRFAPSPGSAVWVEILGRNTL